MTDRLYRCTGDIQFDDSVPGVGQFTDVQLKPFSETCNYLQYQKPLTKEKPCFFAQIRSLCPNSVVSLGIASSEIADEVHPGNWNGSVGYRNTGKCISSHHDGGNTDGEKFGVGDIFGILVTYFGKKWSTVVFLRNGTPVATRYLFSSDHSQYLPTVALENGPIELGLVWPDSVMGPPSYSEKNMLHWIKGQSIQYNSKSDEFCTSLEDTTDYQTVIQSPVPLSKDILHYEIIVKDASESGSGPVTAICSCSPMYPRPTIPIQHDYFKWVPDGKVVKTQVGERIGWGVHYDPSLRNKPDFDDKAEQPVLCYVSKNTTIVFAKLMIQPEGGWYPAVGLNNQGKKVRIDVKSNRKPVSDSVLQLLDETYANQLKEAEEVMKADRLYRSIKLSNLRLSNDLKVTLSDTYTKVVLPRDKKGIHVLQFTQTLTKDQSFYCFEVRKMGDSSVVCAGVAGGDFPQNRYPGRLLNSVGYHSRDGRMYYNDKHVGNMMGKRYSKGDLIGVEVDLVKKDLSVVLFRKNHCPVGTRYHTHNRPGELFPTIAICSNGSEVELDIVFQNRISGAPSIHVNKIEHWCVPESARLDPQENMVYVDVGHTEVEAIQAPYSLDRYYNHFEVQFLDEVDESTPPPAIALCTASPMDPPPISNFKQDFLRFWATGEARKAVKKGDLMGWGVLYADADSDQTDEQLVICYLSINRDVALTRVMYQPPGGFYPVVLIPAGVDRVKLNFGATIIREHPFTPDAIQKLLKEAREMIVVEERKLASGADPEEWDSEENKGKYLKPVPVTATNITKFKEFRDKLSIQELANLRKRPSKVENLVEMMLEQNRKQGLKGKTGDVDDLQDKLKDLEINRKNHRQASSEESFSSEEEDSSVQSRLDSPNSGNRIVNAKHTNTRSKLCNIL